MVFAVSCVVLVKRVARERRVAPTLNRFLSPPRRLSGCIFFSCGVLASVSGNKRLFFCVF